MSLINKFISFFLIFIFLVISGCKSAQKAFVPEKKKGSDAFLVKKKSPLVMPPSYGELPKPNEEVKKKYEKTDIQGLILGSDGKIIEKEKTTGTSSIEKLILKEIKKN